MPELETGFEAQSGNRLVLIKTLHTAVWAFFVVSIAAVPITAWTRRFGLSLAFTGIVLIEVLILLLNRWSCPLTAIAARYTPDRRDNFDIYLPEWLAKHNKLIFGALFVFGLLFALARWLGWLD